jgi:GAF domain-containing protein
MSDDIRAAVAAGILAADQGRRPLLQSIVEVARAIFGAQASSIMLHDAAAGELVFEAVAGAGEDSLIGTRLPESTGLAGWVLASREPLVIEDVTRDPRFAGEVAERTGYRPKGIMAAPLEHEDRVLGVLSVLDRPQRAQFSMIELDLLGLFANQAAIALEVLQTTRRAEAALEDTDETMRALARLAGGLDRKDGRARERADRLIAALADVIAR